MPNDRIASNKYFVLTQITWVNYKEIQIIFTFKSLFLWHKKDSFMFLKNLHLYKGTIWLYILFFMDN